MRRRIRLSVGALVASAALVLGSATAASADWAGPFTSLKYCQKVRNGYVANGHYAVGQCHIEGGYYIFYFERL